MQYRFKKFLLDTDEKTLSWSGQPVTLTAKTYEILQLLVQHQGELVGREELIQQVWKGRIVTDNTLDQNLYRLRKALDSLEPGKYIEAVYGQGLRFLPVVEEGAPPAENAPKLASSAVRPMRFAVAGLALLGLVSLLWWTLHVEDSGQPGAPQPSADNLEWKAPAALAPGEATAQRPPVSLAAYRFYLGDLLSELLAGSAYQVEDLPSASSSNAQSQEFVLSISAANEDAARDGVEIRFQAPEDDAGLRVTLVSVRGGVRQAPIAYTNSQALPLFAQVMQALEEALQLESRQERVAVYLPATEAVLTAHLEATAARMRGEAALANQNAQWATDSEPDFPLAWYELALSFRDLGELESALAVVAAVAPDRFVSANPRFSYRLGLLHAQLLEQLGRIDEAEQRYNAIFDRAASQGDEVKLASVRISQAIMYRKAGDYPQAQSYLDEARTWLSIEQYPRLFGTWANTQARLSKITGDNRVAMEHAILAADAFRQAGHVKYEMASSNLAASLLLAQREHSEAERLIKSTLFTNESIGNVRGQCDNLFLLAGLYQHSGRLQLARQRWDEVIACKQDLGLTGREALAYLEAMRTALAQKKPREANNYLRFLQTLVQEQGDESLAPYARQAEVEMAIAQQDQALLQALLETEQVFPDGRTDYYRGVLAELFENEALAKQYFVAGREQLPPGASFDLHLLYLNGLNRIYAKINPEKLRENLALCQAYRPSAYPFMKYQALVALHDENPTRARQLLEAMKLEAPEQWWPEDAQMLDRVRQATAAYWSLDPTLFLADSNSVDSGLVPELPKDKL